MKNEMKKVKIEQKGEDCYVTMDEERRRIRHCDALLLKNTVWDKDAGQYSIGTMREFGFVRRNGVQSYVFSEKREIKIWLDEGSYWITQGTEKIIDGELNGEEVIFIIEGR